jgi:hypothetical protein
MLHNSTAKQTKPLLLEASESLMTWLTRLTKWKTRTFSFDFLEPVETKAFTLLYSAFDIFFCFYCYASSLGFTFSVLLELDSFVTAPSPSPDDAVSLLCEGAAAVSEILGCGVAKLVWKYFCTA